MTAITVEQPQVYRYVWGNNPKRATMKGRLCVIEAVGRMNTVLIRFLDDDERGPVSRRALRRVDRDDLHYVRGNLVAYRREAAFRRLDDLDDDELDALVLLLDAETDVPCRHCRARPARVDLPGSGVDLQDACIARLPGVNNACCGHGILEDGLLDSCYLSFDDGLTLYGNAARAAMEMLDREPPPRPPGGLLTLPPVVSRHAAYGSYRWPTLTKGRPCPSAQN